MKRKVNKLESARNALIDYGLKAGLLNKLSDEACILLAEFYKGNRTALELKSQLVQLASMEIQGRDGAILLAKLGIATPKQIKSLANEQVDMILEDYSVTRDGAAAILAVKQCIVQNQQDSRAWHLAATYNDVKDKAVMIAAVRHIHATNLL